MKTTHKVLDTIYTKEEGQDCFDGTHQECIDFVSEQKSFGLEIVPMTKEEIENHPNNQYLLNKEEAIQAMKDGKKVTHKNFLLDEFIFMKPDGHIYDENDGRMTGGSVFDFWTDRKGEQWETGWGIFTKN